MNNENIKVLLTVITEGGTLVRQSTKEKIRYTITKQDVTKSKLPKHIGSQVIKSGTITRYPLLSKDCTQHIKLNEDCYNYFISNYCPEKHLIPQWKKMNQKQRLEYNLLKTCQHLGGKSFTYEILED